jgi:hypothetical protein
MTLGTALVAAALTIGGGETAGDSIDVVVRGTLRARIMAIGGETTGVTITARGVTWELDLSADPEWKERAVSLSGRRVKVTGTLEVRRGVEIRQRSIVTVKSLDPLDPVDGTP